MKSFVGLVVQVAAWSQRRLISIGRNLTDNAKRSQGIPMMVCLMAAMLIWLFLSLNDTHTIDVDLDTRVKNLHRDSVLVQPPTPTVRAKFSGPGTALFGFRFFHKPFVELDAFAGSISYHHSF